MAEGKQIRIRSDVFIELIKVDGNSIADKIRILLEGYKELTAMKKTGYNGLTGLGNEFLGLKNKVGEIARSQEEIKAGLEAIFNKVR